METVTLPLGEHIAAFGQGTWAMGDDPGRRGEEIATLRYGLDRGLSLIDTAEMYGEDRSEQLVGEAVGDQRDQAFLVSKMHPQHASRTDVIAACERSLRRLGIDRIDLYLLHWRGDVPWPRRWKRSGCCSATARSATTASPISTATTCRISGRPAAARASQHRRRPVALAAAAAHPGDGVFADRAIGSA